MATRLSSEARSGTLRIMVETPGFGWAMTPHQRALIHLGYAADQVRDLLPFVVGEQQAEPDAVAAACIDSFVLNVRLIADFLAGGKPGSDLLAGDLVAGWKLDGDLRANLRVWYDLASKHAMHMSRKRVSEDARDVDPVTADDFRQMASDSLAAYEVFLTAYEGDSGT